MRVKIFRDKCTNELEHKINSFIKDKHVIDIKLTTDNFYDRHRNGVPISVVEMATVIIMYTDEE